MKTATEEQFRQYLLGALPAPAAELYDEQSIVDDDFAARLDAVENDLLDAYVQGELLPADREQFERHYLASPLRRQKLNLARSLQHFAGAEISRQQQVAAPSATLTQETRARPVVEKKSLFAAFRFNWQWGFATAAAVLLCVSGGFFWQNLQLRHQTNQAQAEFIALQKRAQELATQINQQQQSNAQTAQELAAVRAQLAALERQQTLSQASPQIAKNETPSPVLPKTVAFNLFPQTRASGEIVICQVPADAAQANFSLRLEPDDFTRYRVELRDASTQKIIWRSGTLTARNSAADKNLQISIAAQKLSAPRYTLEVYAQNANGQSELVGVYPFKVTR